MFDVVVDGVWILERAEVRGARDFPILTVGHILGYFFREIGRDKGVAASSDNQGRCLDGG